MSDAPNEPEDLQRPASAAPAEMEPKAGWRTPLLQPHDPYAALRIPDYLMYASGWIVSVVGQQIHGVAVGWQIFHRVGGGQAGALALGLVGGVQAIPVILLALPAGQIADRFDRRRVLIVTQLMAAIFSAGLAIASHFASPVWSLYGLLGLSATAQALGWPARSALLPQLVPDEIFTNAATWNSSGFQVASMAGPALGGLIVALSVTAAYWVDCACGLGFGILLLLLRPRPIARRREPATLHTLVAGVRFVRRARIILATITLDLFAVLLGGATYLLPMFAADILHVGALGFGWLRAAPAAGALVMALVQAHRPPLRHAGIALLWSVAGFGAATIVFGLSRSFFLSMAMLALTGAFDNVSVVVRHTLVQMLTPEHMRGRVSAVNNVFIGASNEIGGLESGILARFAGPIVSVVAGGIGTLVVVAAVALIWPEIAGLGSLAEVHALDASPDEPLSVDAAG